MNSIETQDLQQDDNFEGYGDDEYDEDDLDYIDINSLPNDQ